MYSREYTVVEEENGRIRGLILAYPANEMNQLRRNVIKCTREMFRIIGPINLLKMLLRFELAIHLPATENDGFYIANLAVFEEHRGKGIAVKLLERAEEVAIEKSLNRLSLIVEIDNARARSVYERFGFRVVERVLLPKRYNKHNLLGFDAMTKTIRPV
jgi:ribosomal protein S18 acetylase RimI-like enzyme